MSARRKKMQKRGPRRGRASTGQQVHDAPSTAIASNMKASIAGSSKMHQIDTQNSQQLLEANHKKQAQLEEQIIKLRQEIQKLSKKRDALYNEKEQLHIDAIAIRGEMTSPGSIKKVVYR